MTIQGEGAYPRLHPARLTLAIAAVLVAILALHYAGVGPAWPAWAEHLYEALEVIAPPAGPGVGASPRSASRGS